MRTPSPPPSILPQLAQLLSNEPALGVEAPEILPLLSSPLLSGGLADESKPAGVDGASKEGDALLAALPLWRTAPETPAGLLVRHLRFRVRVMSAVPACWGPTVLLSLKSPQTPPALLFAPHLPLHPGVRRS